MKYNILKYKISIIIPLIYISIISANVLETVKSKSWAKSVKLEGVQNLYKVSDGLYRSAQPTSLGMQNLKKLGIKTIINLRSFNSDKNKLKGTDLHYVHIYMKTWHPEIKEIVEFIKITSVRLKIKKESFL